MLKLAAVFEDAAGKTHNWSYNEPDPNKSPEEIRALLEAMTQLNLFEKNGIKQFQKLVSAKFVKTIETPLFDLSKPVPEAFIAETNNVFAAQINLDEAETNQTKLDEAAELPEKGDPLVQNPSEEQTRALDSETAPSLTGNSTIPKPINPRKAQVDRVRAYHETRKKKKGKKKRS